MRTSLIPASSAGRPLDQHRVILKKMEKHGGHLGRRGVLCGRRNMLARRWWSSSTSELLKPFDYEPGKVYFGEVLNKRST